MSEEGKTRKNSRQSEKRCLLLEKLDYRTIPEVPNRRPLEHRCGSVGRMTLTEANRRRKGNRSETFLHLREIRSVPRETFQLLCSARIPCDAVHLYVRKLLLPDIGSKRGMKFISWGVGGDPFFASKYI